MHEHLPGPELSVVIPMFNEENAVEPLFQALIPVIEDITVSFEIICVDDGSRDGTLLSLARYHARDPRIKIISFTRNFGKEAALTAGIDAASGAAVIPFDADLQDPPELIREMVAHWRHGARVVLAKRVDRTSDPALKRLTSTIFYWILSFIAHPPPQPNVGDYRLMDRSVVNDLKKLQERTRYMKGLFSWIGYDSVIIEYTRPVRSAGQTKFNYLRLWNLALEGILSFSALPLKLWFYIGFFVAIVSGAYAVFIILRTMIFGVDVPGYASLITLTLFLNGIVLISLGILGEYISRIFTEVKGRPLYLVKDYVGIGPQGASATEVNQRTQDRSGQQP